MLAPSAPAEFPALVAPLRHLAPTRIVLEATGGLATLLATTRVEAQALAHLGEALAPACDQAPSAPAQAFEARLTRRRQLVERLVAEKNRLAQPHLPAPIQADLTAPRQWLEERLAQLDDDLRQALQQSPLGRTQDEIRRSVPGLGHVTARTWLVQLPELARRSHKQIAALVGRAPYTQHSGPWRGVSHIRGGRASVRRVLYRATLTARRCNPVIKAFYHKLKAAGKASNVALTACRHKLLPLLKAMLKAQKVGIPSLFLRSSPSH